MRNVPQTIDDLPRAERIKAHQDATANTIAVMQETEREAWIVNDDQRWRQHRTMPVIKAEVL